MKKILSITTNIPIKTYNNIAYPLSIIFSNCQYANDWLFFNSFLLKYGTEVNDVTLNLPYNIDWDCFEKNIMDQDNSDINDVIEKLKDNQYVYLAVDERFILNRSAFQSKTFIHDVLIYGFDDIKQLFYIVGFDKQHKYTCQQISFANLSSAITSAKNFSFDPYSYEFFGAQNNFSLKLKLPLFNNFKINYNILNQLITSHLIGKEFYSHRGYLCYSGLQIYKKVLKDKEALIDYRNWNIIKEHTQFIFQYMYDRFPQLFGEVLNPNSLIDITNLCLQLSLKYKLDKKESTMQRLRHTVELLYEQEKYFFNHILQSLDQS